MLNESEGKLSIQCVGVFEIALHLNFDSNTRNTFTLNCFTVVVERVMAPSKVSFS